MLYEVFMQRVMHRTGIGRESEARNVIDETLLTLGEALNDEDVELISEKLPASLSGVFVARERGGRKLYPEGLYREVSRSTGLPLSIAMEHAQVACQVFSEALDHEGRETLKA